MQTVSAFAGAGWGVPVSESSPTAAESVQGTCASYTDLHLGRTEVGSQHNLPEAR